MIIGVVLCLVCLGLILALVDHADLGRERVDETVDRDEYVRMTEELKGDE